MQVFYHPDSRLRDSQTELAGGCLIAPWESPSRCDMILAALDTAGIGPVTMPPPCPPKALAGVHDADYLAFLAEAWPAWQAAGYTGEAIATAWPGRMPGHGTVPIQIDGRLGYYAATAETAIESQTWRAACASAASAHAAIEHVLATRTPAFALCRPPGHHASADQFAGYCFINNAAVAAERARDAGGARVAILDIDFHHGNGTQSIFYDRDDVVFVSIHADPIHEFPYFSGSAAERGTGPGVGANHNLALAAGSSGRQWLAAIDRAVALIGEAGCDVVIVSLGVDAYAHDPIGTFHVTTADFRAAGRRLRALGDALCFVLEGGYAIEGIGENVVAVLAGYET